MQRAKYRLVQAPELADGFQGVEDPRVSEPARTKNRRYTAELDVLRLLMAGKSNKQIAAALFISEGTVKTHVNNILGKLGASDRTQAVTTALKRGIVSLS